MILHNNEIYISEYEYNRLQESFPPGSKVTVRDIPDDLDLGPTWCEDMDNYANGRWIIDGLKIEGTHESDGNLYYRTWFIIDGFKYAMEWLDDPEIEAVLWPDTVIERHTEVEDDGSAGWGAILGMSAVALFTGLLVKGRQEKSVPSKRHVKAVQQIQETEEIIL